jgi:hypothetical protein
MQKIRNNKQGHSENILRDILGVVVVGGGGGVYSTQQIEYGSTVQYV